MRAPRGAADHPLRPGSRALTGPVVVCLDKFRGSLTAREAGEALARGLRSGGVEAVVLPVADGGEGTVDAFVAAGARPVPARVTGPDGRPVEAVLAVHGGSAVSRWPRRLGSLCWTAGRSRSPRGPGAPES
ncbi:glycerate kinase [Blastococcus sp. SYSU DS0552]